MKFEDALLTDQEECEDWILEKAMKCDVPVDDIRGCSFGKVKDVFYIPIKMMEWNGKQVLFLGPLFPKPGVSGRKLGLGLHRMIQRIRESYTGDIIYRNVEDNNIDALARFGGFEGDAGGMMVLRGDNVQRPN